MPITVKLTTSTPSWDWIRQTPGRSGRWGDVIFRIDDDCDEADWWVVYEGLTKKETVRVPRSNRILFTAEPPAIKTYNPRFLNQFAKVVTSHANINHPGKILSQQALPWWTGMVIPHRRDKPAHLTYDHFVTMPPPSKTRLISVICSGKTASRDHRRRLHFVDHLRNEFGNSIDVFGADFNRITDKWDGTAPYQYHVCMENSQHLHYWTEKLADTLLGFAFPFYFGCPNIDDYFPRGALMPIDIRNPAAAIATICEAIASDAYKHHTHDIRRARELVLNHFNIFAVIARLTQTPCQRPEFTSCTLVPESLFPTPIYHRFIRRLRHFTTSSNSGVLM